MKYYSLSPLHEGPNIHSIPSQPDELTNTKVESPQELGQLFILGKGCDVGAEVFGGQIFHEHVHLPSPEFTRRLIQLQQLQSFLKVVTLHHAAYYVLWQEYQVEMTRRAIRFGPNRYSDAV